MRYVNPDDVLEHAEVNGEDATFIRMMDDYMKDADDYIDLICCKDCHWLKESGGHANCGGYLTCFKTGKEVDFEDYCSFGERKGADDE